MSDSTSKIDTTATSKDSYTGGTEHGTALTSGPGYGNKKAPDPEEIDTSTTRLGTAHSTENYSGATEFGSGTTAGAGAGNKAPPGGGESKDSSAGKLMEKMGGVLGNEGMIEKGTEKRQAKGAFE